MKLFRPGLPPLIRMAALSGIESTIIYFLGKGGAPDSADEEGRSLLHLAASKGHAGICRLLFEAGASPGNVDKGGNDVLAAAIGSGSNEVVALVKKYLDSASDVGQTSVFITLEDGEFPDLPSWEAEKDLPLSHCKDESCQSSAETIHRRITRHRAVDNDEDWSDIEIVLPVVRRGNLHYSTLDGETLFWVSRMLQRGAMHGWVPSDWLAAASSNVIEERDRTDLCTRLEMLLGEYGIQIEDEPIWSTMPSDETEADASDLPLEVLSYLDDLSPSTHDPLLSYFRDLASMPLLDWQEERLYGRMWQQDRNPEGLRKLVEGNVRFVVREARRFQGFGLDIQDLVGAGNQGLLDAASRFDPERENRFLTYAAWWIRQSIFHALAEHGGRFRLPQRVAGNVAQLNRIVYRMTDELGREPTTEEVAAEGTFAGRELDRLLTIRQTASTQTAEEDDYYWCVIDDQIPCTDPGPDDHLDKEEFKEQIKQTLAGLNEREQNVVMRHFGLGDWESETLESIGQSYVPPISRERVRQVEERALERVRKRRQSVLETYQNEMHHHWDQACSCKRPSLEDEDDCEQV